MICQENRDINDALLRSVQWLAVADVFIYMYASKPFSIALIASLIYVIVCVLWDIRKQNKLHAKTENTTNQIVEQHKLSNPKRFKKP